MYSTGCAEWNTVERYDKRLTVETVIREKREADEVGLSDVTPARGKEESQRVTGWMTWTSGKIQGVPKRDLGIDSRLGKG